MYRKSIKLYLIKNDISTKNCHFDFCDKGGKFLNPCNFFVSWPIDPIWDLHLSTIRLVDKDQIAVFCARSILFGPLRRFRVKNQTLVSTKGGVW